MGSTTAVVLVALIVALMVLCVIAVIVWGAVRALEVRRNAQSGQPAQSKVASYQPVRSGVSMSPQRVYTDPESGQQ